MALKPTTTDIVETSEPATAELPVGFNVLVESKLIGTYLTQTDAEAFVAGQIEPQGIVAMIVEGV